MRLRYWHSKKLRLPSITDNRNNYHDMMMMMMTIKNIRLTSCQLSFDAWTQKTRLTCQFIADNEISWNAILRNTFQKLFATPSGRMSANLEKQTQRGSYMFKWPGSSDSSQALYQHQASPSRACAKWTQIHPKAVISLKCDEKTGTNKYWKFKDFQDFSSIAAVAVLYQSSIKSWR